METISRRRFLRGGMALTAGLGTAYLLGCGSEDPPRDGSPATTAGPSEGQSPAGTGRPTWSQVQPLGTIPPARRDHSLVIDSEGRMVFLFGGRAGSQQLDDLWAYDVAANTWTQLAPAGAFPPARFGHNAVFDAAGARMLVFGGQAGGSFFNDIWAYGVRDNSWRSLSASGPSPRYGAGGAGVSGSLYLSHGFTDRGRFDDTWAFSLTNDQWTEVSPGQGGRPVKRCLMRIVDDPQRGRVLLYGGQTDGTPFLGDLWSYDIAARSWRELAAQGPSARNLYSWVRRGDTSQLLLFGGRTPAGDSGELWSFEPGTDRWEQLNAEGMAPSARNGHDAVWLPARKAMFVFGGRDSDGDLSDSWELAFS